MAGLKATALRASSSKVTCSSRSALRSVRTLHRDRTRAAKSQPQSTISSTSSNPARQHPRPRTACSSGNATLPVVGRGSGCCHRPTNESGSFPRRSNGKNCASMSWRSPMMMPSSSIQACISLRGLTRGTPMRRMGSLRLRRSRTHRASERRKQLADSAVVPARRSTTPDNSSGVSRRWSRGSGRSDRVSARARASVRPSDLMSCRQRCSSAATHGTTASWSADRVIGRWTFASTIWRCAPRDACHRVMHNETHSSSADH
jgi:hypothetical protein